MTRLRTHSELEAENARLRQIGTALDGRICQILGRALGYPRYADDQVAFPGATDADGVCTGEFVAEDLAAQAAERIARLLKGHDAAWNAAIEAAAKIVSEARFGERDSDLRGIFHDIRFLKKETPDADR